MKPEHCASEGCGRPTRNRKPYCTEHLEGNAYVLSVLEGIRQLERELMLLGRGRRVPLDGAAARDLLAALPWVEPVSTAGLKHALTWGYKATVTLLWQLEAAGLVRVEGVGDSRRRWSIA